MKKSVKTVLTVIIVLVVLFLIALPKLPILKGNDEVKPNNKAESGSKSILVEVMTVEPQPLDNNINVTGAVLANESIEIASEMSGKITNIYFKEGDQVNKGDLLISINDDELRAQLEKLKYTKQLYEDSENRMRQLLEREAISQEEYDISLTELNTSTADIKVLEAQIDKSQIRAPFSGVIGLRYVSEGSYITPATPIANLYNIAPAKIEFSVPGRYTNIVGVGDKITFTTEGSEETYEGKVYAIEPKIDPATRTLLVRALSPNKDKKLIPGQFVRISITLESKENAILVPSIAVVPEANGHLVYLVNQGKADSVKVNIGYRGAQEVEIISGVNSGDTLVVSGVQQVKDGAPVQIKSVVNNSKRL